MLTIFGTTTSPFVRRVRVVCIEKGLPFTLVPALTEEGQKALRAVSPIWKVPVLQLEDGRVVYDSRVIIDELTRDGWGTLRAPSTDIRGRVDEENVVTMIDEALLSMVRRFYLARDGASLDVPYLHKEHERAGTIMQHLNSVVVDGFATTAGRAEGGLGRAELALITALDWMDFRQTHDLSGLPGLRAVQARFAQRSSLSSTMPAA
jgi:glutathione S-transferase